MSREDRRDDTWLSDAQLAKCARADAAEPFHSPIPTQIVSNGEYMPMPQTEEQKRVEARTKELADRAAKKLGISRRAFLAGAGGMAATFLAMNEVYGAFFDVDRDEMFDSDASEGKRPPRDLFVFDDQLHMIRQSVTATNRALRALAQGPTAPHDEFPYNPFNLPPAAKLDELGGVWTNWNPALIGDPMDHEIFHFVNFIKSLFFDSQMTVGLLSNITGFLPVFVTGIPPKTVLEARNKFEVLTADQTAGVRNFVNQISGSQRLYAHGLLYPGRPNLFEIQRQIDLNKPDSWKGYTVSLAAKHRGENDTMDMHAWRLDGQDAYDTFELIRKYQVILQHERPAFGNICVHKGFAPTADDTPENGNPEDIPQAAHDWPTFNFIIYHSCIAPVLFYNPEPLQNLLSRQPTLRHGVPDIRWTTRFAQLAHDLPNVYAEVGSTFASTVITFPTVWAHIIGQLLKFMGSRRVVFGSDSLWYGSPQWQIEADKRNMLGLNSARLYHVPSTKPKAFQPVPADFEARIPHDLKTLLEFPGFASDNLSKMRARYLAEGAVPDHTRYGWVRTKI